MKVLNGGNYETYVLDICTIILDPSDLQLTHYGKKEVLALISLLKPEWDQPMAFGDNLGKKDTTPLRPGIPPRDGELSVRCQR